MGSKKIVLGIVTALALVTGFSSATVVFVESCDDLANVNSDLLTNYRVTQDLDCSGSGNSIMIGSAVSPFVGTFDGQGHTITVDINSTDEYIGLFRHTNSASISDLTVSGSVISTFDIMFGDGNVGVVAGLASATTFDDVHSIGTVMGSYQNVGGLIGYTINSTAILNSSSSVSVNASGAYAGNVGGLIGRSDGTVISGSYAIGDVHGSLRVGGLVGIGDGNTVTQSYARGDVDADYAAGGLFGRTFTTNVSNSYAHGYVHVRDGEAGGLIGFVDSTSITNSYAVGHITGTQTNFGGLVANSQGGSNTESNSFWDRESSEMTNSVFGASMSTAEMKDSSTFTGAGWDFDTIWGISGVLNSGYPYLLAIPPTADATDADLMVSIQDNGPISTGSSTYTYTVQYANYGPLDLNDVVLTLYGDDLYIANINVASGINVPSITDHNDGAYIQWTIGSIADGGSGTFSFSITQESDGQYSYVGQIASVTIADPVGDNNTVQISTTVDTVPPDTFITSASSTSVSSGDVVFEFNANEESATFECSIDDGILIEDFVPCTSPYTRTGWFPGEHILYVRAIDDAGNIDLSPALRERTIVDPIEVVSVSPIDGATDISTNTSIVVTLAQPLALTTSLSMRPCNIVCPSYSVIPQTGSSTTFTFTDTNPLEEGTTYTATFTVNNGVATDDVYTWSFTTTAASHGGGGGGGSANPSRDYCPGEDSSPSFYDRSCGNIVETWKTFYAIVSSGGVSSVSDPITVKSFVTDVFALLHISKPVQRKDDSETQKVPEKLIMKVMQVLQKLLNK